MLRHRETSQDALAAQGALRRRIAPRTVASLAGLSLVLLVFIAAGVGSWRWWLENQSHTVGSSTRHDARANRSGQVSVVQPEPVGTDSSIAVSPVPLTLRATRPGRNAREGHADLGVNPASPQTYRAGAILANGARIEEIHSDHVVLERDGKRVRLYVDDHAPAEPPSSNSALIMVGGTDRPAPATANSSDELTDYIRVAPVYQGDAIHALEVYSTQHSNVFTTLGLEAGDRITSVDGVAVTDSSAAIASLRRLTQGEALQVTVERGARLQTISLNGLILTAERGASTE